MALGIMTYFHWNAYPWLVLTFHTGLTHPKKGLELVSARQKPAVCLHHQTKQTLKHTIMKTNLRNISKLAIVAIALTVAFTTTALANGGEKEKPASTQLKFVGNIQNQPVFELNLINIEDEYTVTFRDEAGNELYKSKFKGTAGATKKFLLKSDGFSDVNFNVVITSKKTNTSEIYTITSNQIAVEDTVISKVK
jgi:hypothetical protein